MSIHFPKHDLFFMTNMLISSKMPQLNHCVCFQYQLTTVIHMNTHNPDSFKLRPSTFARACFLWIQKRTGAQWLIDNLKCQTSFKWERWLAFCSSFCCRLFNINKSWLCAETAPATPWRVWLLYVPFEIPHCLFWFLFNEGVNCIPMKKKERKTMKKQKKKKGSKHFILTRNKQSSLFILFLPRESAPYF